MRCTRLTEQFDRHYPGARHLSESEAGIRRAAKGTIRLRMSMERFDARTKLSQTKHLDVVQNVIAHREQQNPALAHRMRRRHIPPAGT